MGIAMANALAGAHERVVGHEHDAEGILGGDDVHGS